MKRSFLIVLISALINAALTVLLLYGYDRKFAPRFYVLDAEKIAADLYEKVSQGKMSAEEADKKAYELGLKAKKVLMEHPRTVIFMKRAVVGGSVEELSY